MCSFSFFRFCFSHSFSLFFFSIQSRWGGLYETALEPLTGHGSHGFFHHDGTHGGVWVVSRFLGKWAGEREGERGYKGGEEQPSSHAFARQGRRRCIMSFKTTPFWASLFLFLWTVNETALFWIKHAISFKRKGRQNLSIPKLVLNFLFVQSRPQLQFWF